MPEREPEPDTQRTPTLGQQLSRRVVDRRDVIGIERMPHPERVRGQTDPERERPRTPELVVLRNREQVQDPEADQVQTTDDSGHHQDRSPLPGIERRPEATQT